MRSSVNAFLFNKKGDWHFFKRGTCLKGFGEISFERLINDSKSKNLFQKESFLIETFIDME